MKKITCKEMGGVCDYEITGETPEAVIEAGSKHVQEMAETDQEHAKVLEMMQETQNDAKKMEQWQAEFMQTWEKAEEV